MSGGTFLWIVYVPRYRRLKMQIFFSHKYRKLYTQNKTITSEYMTTKMMESYFIKTIFCNVVIGTVFLGFLEYLPIIEKNPKWTPKTKKN